MSRRQKRNRPMSEINVVPYIDVMLVLLIIFMITAPLLTQGVKVNLPKAAAKALSTNESQPIIVSVDASGKYFLNVAPNPAQALSANTLQNLVTDKLKSAQAYGQARRVLVKGDSQVNYGKVVQAMVLLQQVGVKNIGLMTQDPDQKHQG